MRFFWKREKKCWKKRTIYFKIWSKCTKWEFFFEWGHMIACYNRTQWTAWLGPGKFPVEEMSWWGYTWVGKSTSGKYPVKELSSQGSICSRSVPWGSLSQAFANTKDINLIITSINVNKAKDPDGSLLNVDRFYWLSDCKYYQ